LKFKNTEKISDLLFQR